MIQRIIAALIVLAMGTPLIAQEQNRRGVDARAEGGVVQNTIASDARPMLPLDPSAWAGSMLIIILAMFLMAAVVGPIVRSEVPQEAPDSHSHGDDEHADAHGHSEGHGHGH